MGLFDRIKEPVFLKQDSSLKENLADLEKLLATVTDQKIRTQIENDIAAIKAGIFGEDAISFELQNSHIPMFIIHDLYLEHEGLSAQIDFLIVTKKCFFLIECKNLYGDIAINSNGDFIRSFSHKKEGIYSPITQGKRHLELIKQIRNAEITNALIRAIFERNFYENYRSVVVLANPKTVLNAKYAKKEIKDQVIRGDQLIEYIQKVNSNSSVPSSSDKEMEQQARHFLEMHHICKSNYTEKYLKVIQAAQILNQNVADNVAEIEVIPLCPKCGAPMIKRKATKGTSLGKEFWGCSNYPRCHGIINIISIQ